MQSIQTSATAATATSTARRTALGLIALALIISTAAPGANAASCTLAANGNWNGAGVWSGTGCTTSGPAAADTATISGDFVVTLVANTTIATLTNGASTGGRIQMGTFQLTATTSFTVPTGYLNVSGTNPTGLTLGSTATASINGVFNIWSATRVLWPSTSGATPSVFGTINCGAGAQFRMERGRIESFSQLLGTGTYYMGGGSMFPSSTLSSQATWKGPSLGNFLIFDCTTVSFVAPSGWSDWEGTIQLTASSGSTPVSLPFISTKGTSAVFHRVASGTGFWGTIQIGSDSSAATLTFAGSAQVMQVYNGFRGDFVAGGPAGGGTKTLDLSNIGLFSGSAGSIGFNYYGAAQQLTIVGAQISKLTTSGVWYIGHVSMNADLWANSGVGIGTMNGPNQASQTLSLNMNADLTLGTWSFQGTIETSGNGNLQLVSATTIGTTTLRNLGSAKINGRVTVASGNTLFVDSVIVANAQSLDSLTIVGVSTLATMQVSNALSVPSSTSLILKGSATADYLLVTGTGTIGSGAASGTLSLLAVKLSPSLFNASSWVEIDGPQSGSTTTLSLARSVVMPNPIQSWAGTLTVESVSVAYTLTLIGSGTGSTLGSVAALRTTSFGQVNGIVTVSDGTVLSLNTGLDIFPGSVGLTLYASGTGLPTVNLPTNLQLSSDRKITFRGVAVGTGTVQGITGATIVLAAGSMSTANLNAYTGGWGGPIDSATFTFTLATDRLFSVVTSWFGRLTIHSTVGSIATFASTTSSAGAILGTSGTAKVIGTITVSAGALLTFADGLNIKNVTGGLLTVLPGSSTSSLNFGVLDLGVDRMLALGSATNGPLIVTGGSLTGTVAASLRLLGATIDTSTFNGFGGVYVGPEAGAKTSITMNHDMIMTMTGWTGELDLLNGGSGARSISFTAATIVGAAAVFLPASQTPISGSISIPASGRLTCSGVDALRLPAGTATLTISAAGSGAEFYLSATASTTVSLNFNQRIQFGNNTNQLKVVNSGSGVITGVSSSVIALYHATFSTGLISAGSFPGSIEGPAASCTTVLTLASDFSKPITTWSGTLIVSSNPSVYVLTFTGAALISSTSATLATSFVGEVAGTIVIGTNNRLSFGSPFQIAAGSTGLNIVRTSSVGAGTLSLGTAIAMGTNEKLNIGSSAGVVTVQAGGFIAAGDATSTLGLLSCTISTAQFASYSGGFTCPSAGSTTTVTLESDYSFLSCGSWSGTLAITAPGTARAHFSGDSGAVVSGTGAGLQTTGVATISGTITTPASSILTVSSTNLLLQAGYALWMAGGGTVNLPTVPLSTDKTINFGNNTATLTVASGNITGSGAAKIGCWGVSISSAYYPTYTGGFDGPLTGATSTLYMATLRDFASFGSWYGTLVIDGASGGGINFAGGASTIGSTSRLELTTSLGAGGVAGTIVIGSASTLTLKSAFRVAAGGNTASTLTITAAVVTSVLSFETGNTVIGNFRTINLGGATPLTVTGAGTISGGGNLNLRGATVAASLFTAWTASTIGGPIAGATTTLTLTTSFTKGWNSFAGVLVFSTASAQFVTLTGSVVTAGATGASITSNSLIQFDGTISLGTGARLLLVGVGFEVRQTSTLNIVALGTGCRLSIDTNVNLGVDRTLNLGDTSGNVLTVDSGSPTIGGSSVATIGLNSVIIDSSRWSSTFTGGFTGPVAGGTTTISLASDISFNSFASWAGALILDAVVTATATFGSSGAVTSASTATLQTTTLAAVAGTVTISSGLTFNVTGNLLVFGSGFSIRAAGSGGFVNLGSIDLSVNRNLNLGGTVKVTVLSGSITGSSVAKVGLNGVAIDASVLSSYTGQLNGPSAGATTDLTLTNFNKSFPLMSGWAGTLNVVSLTSSRVTFTSALVSSNTARLVCQNTGSIAGTITIAASSSLAVAAPLRIGSGSTLTVLSSNAATSVLSFETGAPHVVGSGQTLVLGGATTLTVNPGASYGALTGTGALQLAGVSISSVQFSSFTGTIDGPIASGVTTVTLENDMPNLSLLSFRGSLTFTASAVAYTATLTAATAIGSPILSTAGTAAIAGAITIDVSTLLSFAITGINIRSGGVLAIDAPAGSTTSSLDMGAIPLVLSTDRTFRIGSSVGGAVAIVGGAISGSGNSRFDMFGATFSSSLLNGFSGLIGCPATGATTTITLVGDSSLNGCTNFGGTLVLTAATQYGLNFSGSTGATVVSSSARLSTLGAATTAGLITISNAGGVELITLGAGVNPLRVTPGLPLTLAAGSASVSTAVRIETGTTIALSSGQSILFGAAGANRLVVDSTGGTITGSSGTIGLINTVISSARFSGFTGDYTGPASGCTSAVTLTGDQTFRSMTNWAGALAFTASAKAVATFTTGSPTGSTASLATGGASEVAGLITIAAASTLSVGVGAPFTVASAGGVLQILGLASPSSTLKLTGAIDLSGRTLRLGNAAAQLTVDEAGSSGTITGSGVTSVLGLNGVAIASTRFGAFTGTVEGPIASATADIVLNSDLTFTNVKDWIGSIHFTAAVTRQVSFTAAQVVSATATLLGAAEVRLSGLVSIGHVVPTKLTCSNLVLATGSPLLFVATASSATIDVGSVVMSTNQQLGLGGGATGFALAVASTSVITGSSGAVGFFGCNIDVSVVSGYSGSYLCPVSGATSTLTLSSNMALSTCGQWAGTLLVAASSSNTLTFLLNSPAPTVSAVTTATLGISSGSPNFAGSITVNTNSRLTFGSGLVSGSINPALAILAADDSSQLHFGGGISIGSGSTLTLGDSSSAAQLQVVGGTVVGTGTIALLSTSISSSASHNGFTGDWICPPAGRSSALAISSSRTINLCSNFAGSLYLFSAGSAGTATVTFASLPATPTLSAPFLNTTDRISIAGSFLIGRASTLTFGPAISVAASTSLGVNVAGPSAGLVLLGAFTIPSTSSVVLGGGLSDTLTVMTTSPAGSFVGPGAATIALAAVDIDTAALTQFSGSFVGPTVDRNSTVHLSSNRVFSITTWAGRLAFSSFAKHAATLTTGASTVTGSSAWLATSDEATVDGSIGIGANAALNFDGAVNITFNSPLAIVPNAASSALRVGALRMSTGRTLTLGSFVSSALQVTGGSITGTDGTIGLGQTAISSGVDISGYSGGFVCPAVGRSSSISVPGTAPYVNMKSCTGLAGTLTVIGASTIAFNGLTATGSTATITAGGASLSGTITVGANSLLTFTNPVSVHPNGELAFRTGGNGASVSFGSLVVNTPGSTLDIGVSPLDFVASSVSGNAGTLIITCETILSVYSGFVAPGLLLDRCACASSPCQNGGTCNIAGIEWACTCAAGYSGHACQTEINECSSSPCLNGGSCVDGVNSYHCACAPGFTGTFCGTDVNECASNPCMNGGVCTDLSNGYNCTCAVTPHPLLAPSGVKAWEGRVCEIDRNECTTANGGCPGVCTNSIGSYICEVFMRPGTMQFIPVPVTVSAPILYAPFAVTSNMGSGRFIQFSAAADYVIAPGVGLGSARVRVRYGISSFYDDFECVTLTSIPQLSNVTILQTQNVTCELGVTLGLGVGFTFWSNVNTSQILASAHTINGHSNSGSNGLIPSGDLFDSAAIVFTPGTIRLATSNNGASGITFLTLETVTATDIKMDGFGMANDARFVVTFSERSTVNAPVYPCTIDLGDQTDPTTATTLKCRTTGGAAGVGFHFTVMARGQTAYSTDVLNTPIPPTIDSVHGCAINDYAAGTTADCPSDGLSNIYLTIKGSDFVPESRVTVAGIACPADLTTINTTYIRCQLSYGAGLRAAVIVTGGGTSLKQVNLLSFAQPVITSVTGCGGSTAAIDCNRFGGDNITIVGTNLGSTGLGLPTILIGATPALSVRGDVGFESTRVYATIPKGNDVNVVITLLQAQGSINLSPPGSTATVSYTQCSPGSYQPAFPNEYTCAACPTGRYGTGGKAQCTFCDPGSYANRTGLAACIFCEIGSAQPVSGRENCTLCEPGKSQDSRGQVSCKACELGKYSNMNGQRECTPCEIQSSAAFTGSSSCTPCRGRQYQLNSGQAKCEQCGDSEYLVDASTGTCEPCPFGARCLSNGLVVAEDGYFVTALAGTNSRLLTAIPCVTGSCLDCDADGSGFSQIQGGDNSNKTSTLAASCCADGRLPASQNALCGTCQDDYYEWGGHCVDCSKTNNGYLVLLLFIAWLYVLAFHVTSQSTSPLSRIVINFLQFAYLFYGPDAQSVSFMAAFNFNVFQTSAPTCVARMDAWAKLNSGILVPLICLGQLMLTAIIFKLIHMNTTGGTVNRYYRMFSCCQPCFGNGMPANREGCCVCTGGHYGRGSGYLSGLRALLVDYSVTFELWRSDHQFHYQSFVRTLIALILFSYNSIVNTVVTFWNCVDVNGVDYMVAYPSIQCSGNDQYDSYTPIYYALVIGIVAGVPIVLAIFLYWAKRNNKIGDKVFAQTFGIVYEGYADDRYAYEVIVLLRRTVAVATFTLLPSYDTEHRHTQFVALTIVNILFLGIHFVAQPYRERHEFLSEGFALLVLALLTTILSNTTRPIDTVSSLGISALLAVTTAALLLVLFVIRAQKVKILRSATINRLNTKVGLHQMRVPGQPSPATVLPGSHLAAPTGPADGSADISRNGTGNTVIELPGMNRNGLISPGVSAPAAITGPGGLHGPGGMPTALPAHAQYPRVRADTDPHDHDDAMNVVSPRNVQSTIGGGGLPVNAIFSPAPQHTNGFDFKSAGHTTNGTAAPNTTAGAASTATGGGGALSATGPAVTLTTGMHGGPPSPPPLTVNPPTFTGTGSGSTPPQSAAVRSSPPLNPILQRQPSPAAAHSSTVGTVGVVVSASPTGPRARPVPQPLQIPLPPAASYLSPHTGGGDGGPYSPSHSASIIPNESGVTGAKPPTPPTTSITPPIHK